MNKNNNFQKSKGDIIVFDIGGTWFRSGIYNETGNLIEVSKQPAKNYKNTQFDSISDLQDQLIQYIKKEVERLKKMFSEKKLSLVAISMGAALNAHTGYIYNSGPLWGPNCKPFDLKKSLKEAMPRCNFSIVNDVSAALLREVAQEKNKNLSKIMLIAISTGIACRIFDIEKKEIPVDKKYGLQGEIGHIPIRFTCKDQDIALVCDCGGENHLNAFSSGRGIIQVLQTLMNDSQNKELLDFQKEERDSQSLFTEFVKSLKADDRFAFSILDAVIKPLADILLVSFTLDPEIEKVIFTGGVVHSLKPYYIKSLLGQLNEKGMYQITTDDPDFFRKRLFEGKDDGNSGLIGAALSA